MTSSVSRGLGLALLLSAGAAAAQPRITPPREPHPLELWVEPVGPLLGSIVTLTSDYEVGYLPMGMTWRRSPEAQPWTAELALYSLYFPETPIPQRTLGARFSVGPVYGAGPGESGPFVQTLGTLQVHQSRRGEFQHHTGLGLEWGADVGYRFQLGRLSLTPLLGVGFGVGFGERPEATHGGAYPAVQVAVDGSDPGPIFIYNVNLDLLRVGYSF